MSRAAPRPEPERAAFRAFVGSRAATRDRAPRSLREAFPAERAQAVEYDLTPRFDPERHLVGPTIVALLLALAALITLGVIRL